MKAIKYYYCKNCNIGVDTKEGKCPKCRKNFRKPGVQSYTKEQIDEILQNRMEKLEEAPVEESVEVVSDDIKEQRDDNIDNIMVCPKCGKRYGYGVDFCLDCKMPLVIYYEEAEHITDAAVVGEVEDVLGLPVNHPTWQISLTRYVNGVPDKAKKDIVLSRHIMSIGRSYVAKNQLFSGTSEEIAVSVQKVSAYNALFIQKDGKLYIQYDWLIHKDYQKDPTPKPPSRKASIYINGDKLPFDQRRQLTVNDEVLMGDAAITNRVRCMEIVIEKVPQQEEVVHTTGNTMVHVDTVEMFGQMTSMAQVIGQKVDMLADVMEGVSEIVGNTYIETKNVVANTKEMQEALSSLTNLQVERFDKVGDYIKKLEEGITKFRAEDKRTEAEYMEIFLKNNPKKNELLESLNEAQLYYLSSAATIEVAMDESGLEEADYSGAYIFIGKMIENFLYNNVHDMFDKYYGFDWYKSEKMFKTKSPDEFTIGDYTGGGLKNHKEDFYVKLTKDLNEKLGIKVEEDKLKEENVEELFSKFEEMKTPRNESAHGSSEALKRDQVQKMIKEDYYRNKSIVFNTNVLLEIIQYHKVLFGVKNKKYLKNNNYKKKKKNNKKNNNG